MVDWHARRSSMGAGQEISCIARSLQFLICLCGS